MADSSLVGEYRDRIHSLAPSGRIRKGCSIVSENAGSLNNFQTALLHSNKQTGFLSKSERLISYSNAKNTPGPGNYLNHEMFDKVGPSYSKKGTGGLASKSKQCSRFISPGGPGPGIYSLPGVLASRKDFSKGLTRVFAAPVAEHGPRANGLPVPHCYDHSSARALGLHQKGEMFVYTAVFDPIRKISGTYLGKANNVTADAAFKSRSKRQPLTVAERSRFPAPDRYIINDELRHDSVKVPFSSFKSQSKRDMIAKPNPYPGPGYYRPNEEVQAANRLIYPRKHYLSISSPAEPLPQMPPFPGPGSYETADYADPPRHHMSGSSFVSTSSRWTMYTPPGMTDLPGPGYYRPARVGKQSFIFNAASRWI